MNTTSPTASGRGNKTRTPKAAGESARPELSRFPDRWIKAPTKGRCPESGLTRPALYELAKAGKVKSACIRKPGAIRGNRLFHLGSILAFLEAEAAATAEREVRP